MLNNVTHYYPSNININLLTIDKSSLGCINKLFSDNGTTNGAFLGGRAVALVAEESPSLTWVWLLAIG